MPYLATITAGLAQVDSPAFRQPSSVEADSLTKVRHCEYDGSPAPLQPDLHPADRGARGVLGTGRPLAVSRLLFEIGTAEGITARDLRERLDLDSGHLSRMLRHLEAEGLVSTRLDPTDQRRRVVAPHGRGASRPAGATTAPRAWPRGSSPPLTDRQRERLTDALATADLLVQAATVRLARSRPTTPAPGTPWGATSRRSTSGSDRLPGRRSGRDSGGAGVHDVLATSDGEPVAYGGIRAAGRRRSRRRRSNGCGCTPTGAVPGLGSRMLRHLEALAVEHDAQRIVLDTNEVLAEAIAMRAIGVSPGRALPRGDPHATHFFEKVATG